MRYIHQKEEWPNFYWDMEMLAPLLARVRCQQGRLLGQMEAQGFQLRDEASLVTITSDVVKSCAIEGENLDSEQVRSSVARHLGLDAGGVSAAVGRHVDGVVEMMLDATQNHAEPLSSERLFEWHSSLFPAGRSGMLNITVGTWRPLEGGPMQVVSGAFGKERVHFEAPSAERIPDEMSVFLQWFNRADDIDPVLKAAVAHFWFITIHPFDDGNGRIARAIADMALARSDETAQRYYSMSTQIEKERNQYYDCLQQSQRSSLDITVWINWFLGCLDRAIIEAQNTLATVLHKAWIWEQLKEAPVNERQRKVINRMLVDFNGYLNSSKYAKMTKCSTDTALRDIRALLKFGVLIKNERGGRSTSYRLAER